MSKIKKAAQAASAFQVCGRPDKDPISGGPRGPFTVSLYHCPGVLPLIGEGFRPSPYRGPRGSVSYSAGIRHQASLSSREATATASHPREARSPLAQPEIATASAPLRVPRGRRGGASLTLLITHPSPAVTARSAPRSAGDNLSRVFRGKAVPFSGTGGDCFGLRPRNDRLAVSFHIEWRRRPWMNSQ